jgi:SulP family sulfate permease
MLESVVRAFQEKGGDVYLMGVNPPVMALINSTHFSSHLGADHFLSEDKAIEHMFYRVIDPAVCIYESDVRVFRECQNLPRPDYPVLIPLPAGSVTGDYAKISPHELFARLQSDDPIQLIDLREPREYRQGHIVEARLLPLPDLLLKSEELNGNHPVVLICRSGRRSARAAHFLHGEGYRDLSVLEGGMIAWEAAGLLTAVDMLRGQEVRT